MEPTAELICDELDVDDSDEVVFDEEIARKDEMTLEEDEVTELSDASLSLLPPPPQANNSMHPHTNNTRNCQLDARRATFILFFRPIWLIPV